MDRLESMEVFVTTVERGSLAAAARKLDMTAAMAGKHLRALEQRLGLKLLHRTTRRHSLTDAGRRYFERCRQHLRDIDDTERTVADATTSVRGELRIASPVSFGSMLLAPALADFLAKYQEVNVELRLNDEPADLVDGAFDAAVRIGALKDSSLIARPLGRYRVLICASPAYLERHGTPRTPSELTAHDTLGFTHWDKGGGWTLGRGGSEVDVGPPRLRCNNGQALRAAALRGAGLVMQPEALLGEDVAAGRLVPVLTAYLRPARPMFLVYARDRQAPPKLTKLIEFLTERFATRPSR